MSTQLSTQRFMPSDLVEEYNNKLSSLSDRYQAFIDARNSLESATMLVGTFGETIWGSYLKPEPSPENLHSALKKSAWKRVYNSWIKNIATAKDKSRLEIMLESPPEFDIENIKDQFGDYVRDPWGTVLRGLAEVFSDLDPYYKSHTHVGVGKKGLPKRIIISGFNSYSRLGQNKLNDVINSIRAYRQEPLPEYSEIADWVDQAKKNEYSILSDITCNIDDELHRKDDIKLKLFNNGNGHLFFGELALKDINKALSEFYGEVLPDTETEVDKKRASTELSKDLQYYPTPKKVIDILFRDVYLDSSMKVLEPSCGCGRILDFLKIKGIRNSIGVEFDNSRVNQCLSKGHRVIQRNFLELIPVQEYDLVVMNPPFYGKHYIKHVEKALKWLKNRGELICLLPSSARYDHKLINKEFLEENNASTGWGDGWTDLPVGSFSESGTNINTSFIKIRINN